MLQGHPRTSWFRTITLAWTILWTLAVPLVHVHPEVSHNRSGDGQTPGGISHTVLSPDLPGEYGGHHQGSTPSGGDRLDQEVPDLAEHSLNHPEISLSLLTVSPDRKEGKVWPAGTASGKTAEEPVHPTLSYQIPASLPSPAFLLLSAPLSDRAPPLPAA